MNCICSSSGKIKFKKGLVKGIVLKCTECGFDCPQYDGGSGLYWYKGNSYKYKKDKFLIIK